MAMTADLMADHDAALFDLDGVVYLGDVAVPAAPAVIGELRRRDIPRGFVTNNASRTPEVVAEQLRSLGIDAGAADVITSAQAVRRMLSERFEPGSRVLVLGAPALTDEVVSAGMTVVGSADDGPVAVVQGLFGGLRWDDLCEAAVAIQRGAAWIAANTDTTRPTERGLYPGCGASVAALRFAVTIDPEVAGKPYPPLMLETMGRLGCRRPVFVGDRLDTDIAGASGIGIDSLFVLTGAHGLAELVEAAPERRPTHLGSDVGALLAPARTAVVVDDVARCGRQQVSVEGGRVVLAATPADASAVLDAAWAVAHLVWARADRGEPTDSGTVVAQLTDLSTQRRADRSAAEEDR